MVPVEKTLPGWRSRNLVAPVGRPQLRGCGHSLLEGGRAGHQLEGRAGRVGVRDGVVAQWLVGIAQVRVERGGADPGREGVVVVAGQRDHRQDLARLWVQHDRHALLHTCGAHPPRERVGCQSLQARIDGQHQISTGPRLGRRRDHFDRTAARIALHLLRAVGPAQDRLVRGLHPVLADRVVRQVTVLGQGRQLPLADGTGVAEDVREQRAVNLPGFVQILPNRIDLDDDARDRARMLREKQRLVAGDAAQEWHLVIWRAVERVQTLPERGRPRAGTRRHARQHHVARPRVHREVGRDCLDRPRGDVDRDRPASPVEDETTRRFEGQFDRASRDGAIRVEGAVEDLHLEEAATEDGEQQGRRQREGNQARPRARQVDATFVEISHGPRSPGGLLVGSVADQQQTRWDQQQSGDGGVEHGSRQDELERHRGPQ